MDYQYILVDVKDRIATVTINCLAEWFPVAFIFIDNRKDPAAIFCLIRNAHRSALITSSWPLVAKLGTGRHDAEHPHSCAVQGNGYIITFPALSPSI